MGCSTLYHLAKLGISDAILLERNQLTSGTTWHSAAQVRALRSTQNLTNLIQYSISLYSQLEKETGQSVGWINKGSLSIATSPDRLIHIRRQEALAHLFGVEAEFLPSGEALERWPLMRIDDVLGAVWSPEDGRVSPSDLCAALIKSATALGASVFENTPVTGIETKNNRVVAVVTPSGTIRCDAVAICAGLWSRQVGAMAGVAVPLYPCEHFYLLTNPFEGFTGNLPTLSDHNSHLYIRDESGGLLVGCFEPIGKAVSPEELGENFSFQLLPEDWEHFEPMMRNALHRLPPLADAGVKMLLNGPESFTPDGAFLLGETAETRGLFLGCGMNSVGVATGGGAGMALAYCIHNGHFPEDLHEVNAMRFPDAFNSVDVLCARAPEVLGRHYEISYPNPQWNTARNIRLTSIHDELHSAGACFAQVAGWEHPLCFGGKQNLSATFGKPNWFSQVGEEVRQATKGAAIFDLSSFGKIDVTGHDTVRLLDRVCCNRMNHSIGRVIYTPFLNSRGGIEGHLIAVRLGDQHYRLTVGPASVKRDLCWLKRQAKGLQVQFVDRTEDFTVLGLMGQKSQTIAHSLGLDSLLHLKRFHAASIKLNNMEILAVHVSYVGEAGWELTCKSGDAIQLYRILRKQGAQPAGSLAQTSMRIEKRFLSYGHDMDTDTSPIQVGLDFLIDWDKNFIGRNALLQQRQQFVSSQIYTLSFEPNEHIVPLGNEPVLLKGELVGKTTSAAWGYRVGRPLALASLKINSEILDGTEVYVVIGGDAYPANVSRAPAC